METVPSWRIASSASLAAPSGRDRSASATSARNTRAPSFSSASAMPRPMPLPAPVTSALSPSSSTGRRPDREGFLHVVGEHFAEYLGVGRQRPPLLRNHRERLIE